MKLVITQEDIEEDKFRIVFTDVDVYHHAWYPRPDDEAEALEYDKVVRSEHGKLCSGVMRFKLLDNAYVGKFVKYDGKYLNAIYIVDF